MQTFFRRDALLLLALPMSWPFPPFSPPMDPFKYSKEWTGTQLPLKSLEESVASESSTWPMARWPDPILRRPAKEVPPVYFGSQILDRACNVLQQTALQEKAVGLAAEQCGVDARIIYVGVTMDNVRALTLVNPRIIARSPELYMKVWRENCLVLPPTFTATVLRDYWVDVSYQKKNSGVWKTVRLSGETSRVFQHEYDHDRGILITDHVGLDEMDSSMMAEIESKGHEQRMKIAYARCSMKSAVRNKGSERE